MQAGTINMAPANMSQTVVVNQPAPAPAAPVKEPPRQWSSGMCGCFEDCESCLCTYFCCPFYVCCCISIKMDESCCTPICVPYAIIPYRVKMRTKYNITGSVLNDCCCFCCFPFCTITQLAREIKYVERLNDGKAFP